MSVIGMLRHPIPQDSNTIQHVMKDGNIPWFTVLFLCCANAVSFGQRVTVRVAILQQLTQKRGTVRTVGAN